MFLESIRTSQSSPADPTGTTSTTLVMMGLAGSIQLQGSGRILLMLSGECGSGTTANGTGVQLSYGTGTAPTNGAALTGTQVGGLPIFTSLTGVLRNNFALQAIVSGLTVGTTYWLDAAVKAVTAGTSTITNLSLTAIEL